MTQTDTPPAPPATERRRPRILVADDERSMRELLAIVLRREGYDVLLAENGREAIALIEKEPIDLLISDIKMPDVSGVDVLRVAKRIDQDILGIMITAFASTETAVEAMRLGACDYLSKPFDIEVLKMKVRKDDERKLEQENVLLKRTLGLSHQFANIIGRSAKMLEIFKMIQRRAHQQHDPADSGESGTGKELIARAIHYNSLRRERSMVSINCGAMPETLLESELFGHKRGAFTGAHPREGAPRGRRAGHDLPRRNRRDVAVMQMKLLRVLQERRFRRVGGIEELRWTCASIAATNQDLAKAVAEGRFREDLFYRINVIPIALPPLRERREDIPLLVDHFMREVRRGWGRTSPGSRGRPSNCCSSTTGPAISGSWRTSSNGRLRWSGRRPSCPTACRPRSGPPGRRPARPRPTRSPKPALISRRTSKRSSVATSRRRWSKRAGSR